jgi:hypothetical protein
MGKSKKLSKKLSLNAETVRDITGTDLAEAAGGAGHTVGCTVRCNPNNVNYIGPDPTVPVSVRYGSCNTTCGGRSVGACPFR